MKKSTIPKTHLFNDHDLHLYELQNIYAACSLWLENGMENQIATYDLTVRDMPKNRNFMLFGGLEEIIENIRKWKYTKDEVNYLRKAGLATPKLVKYLSTFKFSGDVYAMPEGTAFFPGEPIVRITAPLLEGNLLTMFLMNATCSNTLFLSKIIRLKIASGSKGLIAGGMRSHSFESAMKSTRAAYIAEASTGVPAFSRKYNLNPPPISINAYHAVIKSFPQELDAFRAAAYLFPNNSRPMPDTYDFKQGIKNIIKVSRELEKENNSISAITVDSGDLYENAVYARKMFDKAGFPNIKITLASNLDELKISKLVKRKVPADTFLSATEYATVADDPKLEIVFKLTELRDGRKIKLAAKFAKGKLSYPGRKQVFRLSDKKLRKDIIGLEGEKLGKPLLIKMIAKGKVIYKLPTLDKIRGYVKLQIASLPPRLLSIEKHHKYKVEVSNNLKKLLEKARKEHIQK